MGYAGLSRYRWRPWSGQRILPRICEFVCLFRSASVRLLTMGCSGCTQLAVVDLKQSEAEDAANELVTTACGQFGSPCLDGCAGDTLLIKTIKLTAI